MKCLDPQEANAFLDDTHFFVRSSERGEGIIGLRIRQDETERSLVCQPPMDACLLPGFLGAVNRWLPTSACRILWVNDWSLFYPSFHSSVMAIRSGVGDQRSLTSAPGHLFPVHDYAEEDQVEVSDEQAKEVGLLFGLMSLFIIEQWSVVLLADTSRDYVEFWDGNIVFKSLDDRSIERAREIVRGFNLKVGIR